MRFHSQNLNEKVGEPNGPMWRRGRAWLYLGEEQCVRVEWNLLDLRTWPRACLEVCRTFCDDEDLAGHVSVPVLGSLYWGVQGFFPRAWWDRLRWPRKTGVELFHEYLWLTCWYADPAECWGREEETLNRFKWQRISWDWHTFLLGKQEYRHEVISEWESITIPMPEGTYPGEFRIEQRTWWRPRWPRRLVRRSGEFRSTVGCQYRGKANRLGAVGRMPSWGWEEALQNLK